MLKPNVVLILKVILDNSIKVTAVFKTPPIMTEIFMRTDGGLKGEKVVLGNFSL